MKSVQELRVDAAKQQLLESRMTMFTGGLNMSTATDGSNSAAMCRADICPNQSSSETNDVAGGGRTPTEFNADVKMEDNSSSAGAMFVSINNSGCSGGGDGYLRPIFVGNSQQQQTNTDPQTIQESTHSPVIINQQQPQHVRRRKKSKIESPHGKRICNRTEKRIDEMFKAHSNCHPVVPPPPPPPPPLPAATVQQQPCRVSPHRNSCSDSSVDSNHDCVIGQQQQPLLLNKSVSLSMSQTVAPSSTTTVGVVVNHQHHNNSISSCVGTTGGGGALVALVKKDNVGDQQQDGEYNSKQQQQTDVGTGVVVGDVTTTTMMNLKRKVEELEQRVDQEQEFRQRAREVLIKVLMQQTDLERRANRERMLENNLQLGEFKICRVGAHYEEKWCSGQKYIELDKKRKMIEESREDNEKRKKMWNKKRPGRDGDKVKGRNNKCSPELDPIEFYTQAEIHDLKKMSLNKEEKDLQAEAERLDRERILHIRETKRIRNEEASRFRHYPILHDRYLILSLLGKGGFSEVHKGFDLDQLCFVACKIHELNPQWPQEKKDSYSKHALREISIHKSLDHRRIVRVHDVFNIDKDAFCTVLEFCEGNDLDFFLKQNKCLPEREAKSIVCQVVSALRHLNERRNPIIHYDLKPGNILLCQNGDIKITDFGLSKIFPDNHHNADGMELTSQGAGTYWYLPPECFVTENGPPTISSKVDVWSVGVIFFQCLYGKKPFGDNETQTDILHNNTILQARSITFPSYPKVSDPAKDFIRRCCTYRKELRPDVFQLCNDDYLKPKSQLKHGLDASALPGPSSVTAATTVSQSPSVPQLPPPPPGRDS